MDTSKSYMPIFLFPKLARFKIAGRAGYPVVHDFKFNILIGVITQIYLIVTCELFKLSVGIKLCQGER